MTNGPEDQPVPQTDHDAEPLSHGVSEDSAGVHEYPADTPELTESSPLRNAMKWVLGVVVFALLAYPVIQRFRSGGSSTPSTSDLSAADVDLNRSLQAYQAGQYQAAAQAAQAAIKERPGFALAYNNLAVSYLGLKMYDDATRAAVQAIQFDPGLQLAKNNLVWIQQEKAKAAGLPAPEPPKPNPADNFLNQSLQLYQAGQFQPSIDAARQALKLDPNMAAAYNNIAAAYASMKMWDPAIENAQKALQLQPDMQLARNNLAWALNGKASAPAKK